MPYQFIDDEAPKGNKYQFIDEDEPLPTQKPSPAKPQKPTQEQVMQEYRQYGSPIDEATKAIGRAMIATPISKLAGLASILPASAFSLAGNRDIIDPSQVEKNVFDYIAYQPKTQGGKEITQAVADTAQTLFTPFTAAGEWFGSLVRDPSSDNASPQNMLANTMTAALPEFALPIGAKYAGKIAGPIGKLVKTPLTATGDILKYATGNKARQARQSAVQAVTETVGHGVEGSGKKLSIAQQKQAEANKALQELNVRPADLNTQGTLVRQELSTALEQGQKRLNALGEEAYGKVREIARRKEASGQYVDTSEIDQKLSDLSDMGVGIPGLQNKIEGYRTAIKEGTPTGLVDASGKTVTQPRTFEQLELTRRFLWDEANKLPGEGYSSIQANAARDAAIAIDNALTKHTKQFADANKAYREYAESLYGAKTGVGKRVLAQEGAHDDIFKVDSAKVPEMFFKSKEASESLVNMLAGHNPSKEALKLARNKVNDMTYNWLLESLSTKSGASGLEAIADPKMRAALSASPSVASKAQTVLGKRKFLEERVGGITEYNKKLTTNIAKMKNELNEIDKLSKSRSRKYREEALTRSRRLLDSAYNNKAISKEQLNVAQRIIDNAETIEEKTIRTWRILSGVALTAGSYGAYRTGMAMKQPE